MFLLHTIFNFNWYNMAISNFTFFRCFSPFPIGVSIHTSTGLKSRIKQQERVVDAEQVDAIYIEIHSATGLYRRVESRAKHVLLNQVDSHSVEDESRFDEPLKNCNTSLSYSRICQHKRVIITTTLSVTERNSNPSLGMGQSNVVK